MKKRKKTQVNYPSGGMSRRYLGLHSLFYIGHTGLEEVRIAFPYVPWTSVSSMSWNPQAQAHHRMVWYLCQILLLLTLLGWWSCGSWGLFITELNPHTQLRSRRS